MITQPREDSPRNEFDESLMRIRLYCTDCEPESPVAEHDVAHWREMPNEMQEREGLEFGVTDFVAWLKHMRDTHDLIHEKFHLVPQEDSDAG